MKKIEIYKWLEAKLKAGVWLTDMHTNYIFLEFCDKFYPNKSLTKCIAAFNNDMKELVLNGKCSKNKSSYPGILNEFGRRQITTYIPK